MTPSQVEHLARQKVRIADNYFKTRHHEDAIRAATEAITAATRLEQHRKIAARAYLIRSKARKDYALGDDTESLNDIKKALALDDNIHKGYEILGESLDSMGKPRESLAAFGEALKRDPDNKDLYHKRAAVFRLMADFDGALNDYNTYIKLRPEKSFGYLNRAKILQKLGKTEEALADYQKAFELETSGKSVNKGAGPIRLKALYLIELGRSQDAIDELTLLIQRDHTDENAYRLRGLEYQKLGKLDLALEDLSKSISLYPDYARASLEDRAQLYEKMGKVGLAKKDRARAREIEKKPAVIPVYEIKKHQ